MQTSYGDGATEGFVTRLLTVDLRTAQELAGHSTPALTARPMHVSLQNLAGSVRKLPSILPRDDPPQAGQEEM